jgi:hypothetical protein
MGGTMMLKMRPMPRTEYAALLRDHAEMLLLLQQRRRLRDAFEASERAMNTSDVRGLTRHLMTYINAAEAIARAQGVDLGPERCGLDFDLAVGD